MHKSKLAPDVFEARRLGGLRGIRHGFFTREGGVSDGIYASLNCGAGSDDTREHVAENRARVARTLGVLSDRLVTLYQVHGRRTVYAGTGWHDSARPRADAIVTNRPGVALGILSADCAPVLLADAEAGVIGAAHAGWRGALAGITDSVVDAMLAIGAERERIIAAVGPCISRSAYEVGADFEDRFAGEDPASVMHFAAGDDSNHRRFDLGAYVAGRLHAVGVGAVERIPLCTYFEENHFFSYRRATHRGEADYGRGVSAIALAP